MTVIFPHKTLAFMIEKVREIDPVFLSILLKFQAMECLYKKNRWFGYYQKAGEDKGYWTKEEIIEKVREENTWQICEGNCTGGSCPVCEYDKEYDKELMDRHDPCESCEHIDECLDFNLTSECKRYKNCTNKEKLGRELEINTQAMSNNILSRMHANMDNHINSFPSISNRAQTIEENRAYFYKTLQNRRHNAEDETKILWQICEGNCTGDSCPVCEYDKDVMRRGELFDRNDPCEACEYADECAENHDFYVKPECEKYQNCTNREKLKRELKIQLEASNENIEQKTREMIDEKLKNTTAEEFKNIKEQMYQFFGASKKQKTLPPPDSLNKKCEQPNKNNPLKTSIIQDINKDIASQNSGKLATLQESCDYPCSEAEIFWNRNLGMCPCADDNLKDDAFNVFKLYCKSIGSALYHTEIAEKLKLDHHYTHLILCILELVGLTDHGMSVRGSWFNTDHKVDIKKTYPSIWGKTKNDR